MSSPFPDGPQRSGLARTDLKVHPSSTRMPPRRRAGVWLGAALCAVAAFAGSACADTAERAVPATETTGRVLRVCADPNNLPFSNQAEEGFENRLATLVAAEMNATVEYTWWAQRRGFIRNTLRALECDVVIGVPTTYELVLATRPYYRSTYVFLWRTDRKLHITSLDDEQLRQLRIGVHVIGEDYANPPPAHALAHRGIIENVAGYSIFGDYARANPPARLVSAVIDREVDLAVLWGPFAGYFAARQQVPMTIVPVTPEIDLPFLPMAYDISMGVRRGEETLRDELNDILVARQAEIAALLDAHDIPLHRPATLAGGRRP